MKRAISIWALLGTASLLSLSCSSTSSPPADLLGMAPVGVKVQSRDGTRYPWAPHVDIQATYPASVIDLRSVPRADPSLRSDLSKFRSSSPEMPISPEEAARLRAAALLAPPDADIQIVVERSGPSPSAPALGVSFEALNSADGSSTTPPDPELAVGPSHVIAVVNKLFEIYDKTGTTLAGPTTFASFFTGTPGYPGSVFDPNVLYDESTDRFILGIDAAGTDYCIAATTGSDPTSTWNRYCFATDVGGAFFDYPHIGVGEEAIFLGSNQFSGGFLESRVWAMNKANLYSGGALGVIPTESTGNDSTAWPANLHGFAQGTWPSDTNSHYIATETFDGCAHAIYTWTDPFGAGASFSRGADLDLCAATGVTALLAIDWPNPGGAFPIQGNDWRGQSTFYRNGEIWITNQTIGCNPGGGTVDCVRWARIEPTTNTILDAGVFGSDGEFRTFASLAVNDCGDMAVGYSKGSEAIFPSTYVTGRFSTDPAGTVQAETVLKAGEEIYDCETPAPPAIGMRWGDYTGMEIAPDGVTFWYLGEYSRSQAGCDWATYIGSFTYAGCSASEIFDDGFETGDTTLWSNTVL